MTESIDTYEQALAWLAARVNYERVPPSPGATEFKLDRMRRLLERLRDPHERLPAVHIAGTKGKGSTASMAAAMLSAAGCRTGLFVSPHVHRFEERMTVDGAAPTPAELVALVNAVAVPAATLDAAGPELSPTYFELATAMAWLFFESQGCDLAVLEVGLGGRLDATNLCRPVATAITNISYDHTDVLGRTLAAIAGEKAGIIKPGVPVVSGVRPGRARNVIVERCREHRNDLYELGRDVGCQIQAASDGGNVRPQTPGQSVDIQTPDRSIRRLHVPLAGAHQAANAAIAVALVDLVARTGRPVPEAAVRAGLGGVSIPVRIEFFPGRPVVVIDAAHNLASAAALVATLQESLPRTGRRVLIFAASGDKDVRGMLRRLLPEFDQAVLTRYASNTRGLLVESLVAAADPPAGCQVHTAADPPTAWRMARELAQPDDLVCVTGSFFLAAEVRELLVRGR